MNRRQVLGISLTMALALPTMAQNKIARVKIIELERLKLEWNDAEFQFSGEACVLIRIPEPTKPNPHSLEVQNTFLLAYSRVCTHLGCLAQLPNGLHQLECGCHGSIFRAADGDVLSGPASTPLRAVRLELEDGFVYAAAWA